MSNKNYEHDWTILAEGLINIIGTIIFFILTIGILSALYKNAHSITSKPSPISEIAVFLTLTVFSIGTVLSFIAKIIRPPDRPTRFSEFMFYFVLFLYIVLFITTVLDFYVLLTF